MKAKRVCRLQCPECGESSLKVIDSRKVGIGVRRRRECVNGHRHTTHEQAVNDYSEIQDARLSAQVVVDLLRDFATHLEKKMQIHNGK